MEKTAGPWDPNPTAANTPRSIKSDPLESKSFSISRCAHHITYNHASDLTTVGRWADNPFLIFVRDKSVESLLHINQQWTATGPGDSKPTTGPPPLY